MGLGGNTCFQRQLDSTEHRLLVMVQDQRQDIDHLPVAAGVSEKVGLQLPERIGHLGKGRAVAQGSGLALDYCQIVSPVIDRLAPQVMRAGDNPPRSEEHTSELQSLMRISYAVFCLKKKNSQQK